MSAERLKRSWLVQRLNQPTSPRIAETFAFGGGLRNGGLSDEAMGLLRNIFSFDYMGAAEFEFGAVPEALSRMAKARRELVATAHPDNSRILVLAPRQHLDVINHRILTWAADPRSEEARTKEPVRLDAALRGDEWSPAGWLELSNGFMFFIDREMWVATCELLGVKR